MLLPVEAGDLIVIDAFDGVSEVPTTKLSLTYVLPLKYPAKSLPALKPAMDPYTA